MFQLFCGGEGRPENKQTCGPARLCQMKWKQGVVFSAAAEFYVTHKIDEWCVTLLCEL